jgi:hypothetical protein
MGVAEAEANAEEWELEEPSPEYVAGMGLGATKEATRWAWMGFHLEKRLMLEGALERKKGRPKKSKMQRMDVWRAFVLWRMAQCYSVKERQKLTNRALIDRARSIENELDIPISERAFPGRASLEQSVSRGRTALEIDAEWKSEVCEKCL